jgi:hypothetical protein
MWTTIIRCSGLSGHSTGKLFNVSWSLPGARRTKTSMEDLGCRGQSHCMSRWLVLMLVKKFDSRQMEHYLAENVVARVFLSRQDDPTPQIRDHSSIARAMEAVGAEGVQQVNHLIVQQAEKYGFADPALVSGDTTAQELPIGYPNEPGILRGLAQRCLRALVRLSQKGVAAVEETIQQAKTVLKSVKQYQLFTKQKKEKDLLLRRIIEQTQDLIRGASGVVETVRQSTDRVQKSACQKL